MNIKELIDCYLPVPVELMTYLLSRTNNITEYARVWQVYDGEAIRRTFAYRTRKGKAQEVTEVMREIVSDTGAIFKNCYYTGYSGYTAVYKPTTRHTWYGYEPVNESDFNKWFYEPKALGMTCVASLNSERILKMKKYEHCGYSRECGDLMIYLRAYEKNHAVEYFGKLGIIPIPSYIKTAMRDRRFIYFLKQNLLEVKECNPEVVLYAFRNKKSIAESKDILAKYHAALSATLQITALKGSGIDRVKVYEYLRQYGISAMLYDDYITAVIELGMDLTDTKNLFPYEFKRMHDLRINELEALKIQRDKEALEELNRKFIKIAKALKVYELFGEKYSILIPKDISEIQKEGEELHHCVFKMGYHEKVVNGGCIIAFLRKTAKPEEPFVTIEYLLSTKRISQVYADNDSKPDAEVLEFAYAWGKHVTEILKGEKDNGTENGRLSASGSYQLQF